VNHPPTPLAEDFGAPDRSKWMALVEKTLKGQTFDDALITRTPDGVAIQPLYTSGDGAVVARDLRARDAERPWDLRMRAAHPDPRQAAAEIMKDLEGGAASVLLALDPAGVDGVAVGSPQDLAQALNGVLLDLAPVALDAGFLGPKAADWLGGLAKAAPNAPLAFHMDPLTAFAQAGASPGPIESHLISVATVGARLSQTYAKASLVLATGRAAHSSFPELGESAIDKLLDALMVVRGLELPADPELGRTHYTVGLIDGGVAPNVVSPHASAELMFRIVGDGAPIYEALRVVEGLVALEHILEIPAVHLHRVAGFETAVFPYTTDVPVLTRWGRPLLIGPGSIHTAHTDHEHVSIDELRQAVDLYETLAMRLLTTGE